MPAPRDPEALLHVARLYYVERQSQKQIASALGTSRSNVSRMLTAASDAGLVEIRIVDPAGRDHDLELRLREAFGLSDARVAQRPRTPGTHDALAAVGAVAARLLVESVTGEMTVALSWGTALQAMVWATPTTSGDRTHAVQVTQLVGGLWSIRNEISGQELVRELSARLGASGYHYLHAPATLTSKLARDSLLAEASVTEALDQARRADIAFVGVGTPSHGSSAAVIDSLHLSAREERAFWAREPVGDVAARYFDAQGRPITGVTQDRVLAVTVADLQAIPTVVGVAAGRVKAPGVLGALRGRLLDVLVCDDALARAVLAAADLSGARDISLLDPTADMHRTAGLDRTEVTA
jgi:DNA-binding transcriptional regulator LsrR (DeoR family)